jgi:hypothetical protein
VYFFTELSTKNEIYRVKDRFKTRQDVLSKMLFKEVKRIRVWNTDEARNLIKANHEVFVCQM